MKLSLLSSALLLSPALANAAQPAARPDEVGLRKAWTRALGSAYSGVAVGADRVVTQFGDGEQDHVVALDVRDGALCWQHTLGPTYRGHDGSLDGPISTPAVGAGCAFVVGPRGRLVALELATGEVRWSTHLVDDLGAAAPEYGFTTTPVLEGDVLVVQAGGSEGRNLCGFDAATGALRWWLGEGAAAYQSPAVLELAGSRQLVVLNGRELQGVLPETGALLWTYAFEGRDAASSGQAGAIDGARFHLWVSGRLAVFEVAASAAGFAVRELYRSRELGDTYRSSVAC